MASRRFFAPQVIAYWLISAAIASCAARLISSGAGKSGKPWARLMAPCLIANRVISRMTDSVNDAALSETVILRAPIRSPLDPGRAQPAPHGAGGSARPHGSAHRGSPASRRHGHAPTGARGRPFGSVRPAAWPPDTPRTLGSPLGGQAIAGGARRCVCRQGRHRRGPGGWG